MELHLIRGLHKGGVVWMINYDDFEKEQARREAEFDSISGYLEKNKRIKKEVNGLKRLFSEIEENKKKLVFAMIEEVVFLSVTMKDLRDQIISHRYSPLRLVKNFTETHTTDVTPLYIICSKNRSELLIM